MKRYLRSLLFCLALLCFHTPHATAQEEHLRESGLFPVDTIELSRLYVSCSSLGAGAINVSDTYLSPYDFGGTGFCYSDEQFRGYPKARFPWSYQTVFTGRLSRQTFASRTQYGFFLEKRWSGLHRFDPCSRLSLYAGVQMQGAFGLLYLPVNTNNYISGKARIGAALTGMALYRFLWGQHRWTARYQLDFPLIGIMFAPDYGQSYYEIFGLGHYSNTIRCFSFIDCPSVTHTLSLDIPINIVKLSRTLRFSYMADLYQSDISGIRTHIYTHAFTLGWVKNLYRVKPKDRCYHEMPY